MYMYICVYIHIYIYVHIHTHIYIAYWLLFGPFIARELSQLLHSQEVEVAAEGHGALPQELWGLTFHLGYGQWRYTQYAMGDRR